MSIYRRTSRRQIANCIKGCEDVDGHIVRAPLVEFSYSGSSLHQ